MSDAYADSIVDQWLMFNMEFGYSKSNLEGQVPVEINIPTWIYVNERDAALREIATRLGLHEEDWQFLWELNVQAIKNPYAIDEESSLVVPSKISGWTEIQDLDMSVDQISENYMALRNTRRW